VLGWSMGGSVEETVNVALKKRGLTLDLFIGLSAVPPLPYVMQAGPYDTNKILPNKLADRSILTPIFVKMVEEQSQYHQHDIIPKDIYQDEFLGNFPTALSAEGYHYQNGKFIYNINQTLADGGVFNFADTPWIALIRDDSPSTAKLSLIDPAIWNYLRAEMVYKNYLANQALSSLPRDKWEAISKMIDTLPQQLTMTVHGNHFFFVGEKGARETAEDVDELISRVKKISLSFHR